MRVPLSWLREYVDLPPTQTGRQVAERLVQAGLEVERVDAVGADLAGPMVVGRVLDLEELTGLKKPIRWCSVDVGEGQPRGVICGATNFAVGDTVVVALPGAVLPGGFRIAARKTYGHVSDGMICSPAELGLSTDAAGILVLADGTAPATGSRPGPSAGGPDGGSGAAPAAGDDAVALLGLRDEVLDLAVTADRGYCLSLRGVAREVATAYGVPWHDPADVEPLGDGEGPAHPGEIADPTGCDHLVLRSVRGLDPAAATPVEMQRRLVLAGMRPISLPVDVTNYVMLELGQPLHAFDATKLRGAVVVRRAAAGEKLETLDHVVRDLDADDVLIADAAGPLSLAGTMGGLQSEIDAGSRDLVIEAAHFDPAATGRMSRRHRLSSEASRRFERGVDPELAPRAADRAARLLAELGGATIGGRSEVDLPREPRSIALPLDLPARVVGRVYSDVEVTGALTAVGAQLRVDAGTAAVVPPPWRPDLRDPYDLVEEVARLGGYDTIPSALPLAPPGRGLTGRQRLRRRVGQALAGAGYVEAPSYPFVGPADWDALGLPVDDPRRRALRLANPLSEEEPALRTTLLPGLLAGLRRNVARGMSDVALFETGAVVLPRADPGARPVPRLGVDRRPTPAELAQLEATLPDQPARVAVALAGDREPAGWWGSGRAASWADAVEAARTVAGAVGVRLLVERGDLAPWHPGRCAALRLAPGHAVARDGASGDGVAGPVIGHAGELHPRVTDALGLPARTCAMELDLDAVLGAADADRPVAAPRVSPYPPASQDVALVVPEQVPAGDVEAALVAGAGPLLEAVRLFDVYTGAPVPAGSRSLAYSLRFRAPDRTLTADEVTAARDAAVASAVRRTGAAPRGG